MAEAIGRVPVGHDEDHHTAFNRALKEALKNMDGKFESGKRHTVDVHQQLEVDVNSPGIVGFLQVTLKTSS